MRLHFILFAVLIGFSISGSSQTTDTAFKKEWIDIDTLILQKDLTRTAIAKVKKLYTAAKNRQLYPHLIRSLVYLSSLEDRINSSSLGIRTISEEIASTKNEAAKAILHSLVAKQYKQYYLNHRWNLRQRKNTTDKPGQDITTWSPDDFAVAIKTHYMASLKEAAVLQKQDIRSYQALLVEGNSRQLRPTLYDLLLHEALDYFTIANYYNPAPQQPFLLNDMNLFAPASSFITVKISTPDSSSANWISLGLFQKLLAFHLNDTDKDVLVHNDIKRLEWLKQQGSFMDDDDAYIAALLNITRQFASVPSTAHAWYLLAQLEANKAAGYDPFGDTTHRYGYQKAEEMIEQALRMAPGKEKDDQAELQALLVSIRSKKLGTQTEKVNIPGKPFRALVSAKNIDTLFVRILRLGKTDISRQNTDQDEYWNKLGKLPFQNTFIQPLNKNTDHQTHHTEIKIDALPVGRYALLTSSGAGFRVDNDKMAVQFFTVSNISVVRKENDLFVLHRESGNPIAGAKVILTYTARGKNKGGREELRTDKNGYARMSQIHSSGDFKYLIHTGNDTLDTDEYQFYYSSNEPDGENDTDEEYEKDNEHVYFFTDRSIYRPGQTVYFKGIAVTRDRKTQLSKLLTRKISGKTFLNDVNGKKIDSVQFSLNEFGSFSGSFRLPSNVLTGEFTIETGDITGGNVQFSVEEYKRPNFEVTFDKVKGSYRLNDSIYLTGRAKAFAGNSVSGATVKYRVVRNYRYMPWVRGKYVPREEREITHGEITTLPDGTFRITFKAATDDLREIIKETIFDFNVEADITDISGETHSATTTIAAGYNSLKLAVTAPRVTEADSLKNIRINTSNYSDQKEPALVHITISPLQPEQRLIRSRYWQRPDQFVMSKQEYLSYFPNDLYSNETDMAAWAAGAAVIRDTLNTATSDLFTIQTGRLKEGYYKIEVTARDKYGEEAKQVSYIQLFNGNMSAPTYQFNYTRKSLVEPGEQAVFLTGSSRNNIFVISQLSRPGRKSDPYRFESPGTGIRAITYTPDETDRGHVIMNEIYVSDNRVYTITRQVSVPWSNKQLQVSYASYRNRIEPGSKETWSVSVSGNNSEKVTAELLTVMYDASLDAFKKHDWRIPSLWDISNNHAPFTYHENFSVSRSMENYQPQSYTGNTKTYDRLPENGQELWNQSLNRLLDDSTLNLSIRVRAALDLNEVVVTANGQSVRREFSASVKNIAVQNKAAAPLLDQIESIRIRGTGEIEKATAPLYIVNGEVVAGIDHLDPSKISSIQTLKADEAIALYGASATNGVVIISTNETGIAAPVQVRKNFNETAFFFPHLYADSTGKFSFSFTMPEALTQWKWMMMAHTKELAFGENSATVVTQKKLMVQPNAPRFMREGDNMELSSRIANMTDKEIKGQATLELIDPTTNTSVDGWFHNVFPAQYFTAEAGQTVSVKFPVQIPFSYNKPLTWRIVARSENISDGEENTLPVLSSRTLVTETLPIFLAKDTTQQFVFDKLLHNKSESLTHESVTVEYTSNPVWYAVQALPYLIDFPYECAEQTFNRFYANTLASFIINKHPRIKQVFEEWKKDSASLLSNLQKNEELKQLLLQETPWVLQAGTETQKKKNLALLFDLARLSQQSDMFIKKLEDMQLTDGSFSWFKGGYPDRYITNYILTGIGKLKRLGALTPDLAERIRPVIANAIRFADKKITDEYAQLVSSKANLSQQHIHSTQIDYLLMRSFFRDIAQSSQQAYDYYYKQAKQFWVQQNSYQKAQIGLVYLRNGDKAFAGNTILPALLENTVRDTKMGMYWKSTYASFWYQSPIEHQSMMIAFASELNLSAKDAGLNADINSMKTWLLLNKQTNNWRTTIATADACYALLLNGSDWLTAEKTVTIRLGNTTTASNIDRTEAGTGYLKKRIDGKIVNNEMGNISVSVNTTPKTSAASQSPSWGSIYWQYFEDMDKITPAAGPLSITKKLFIERNTEKGKVLDPVKENQELKIGDRIVVRMELRSDRDMDYLHLKDMRAASMEPVNVLSGYKWQDGLGYYESTRDASTNFFIDHLRKGNYVFEYPLFVTQAGVFSVGIANIQCMYAPEFTSHSGGIKIRVIP